MVMTVMVILTKTIMMSSSTRIKGNVVVYVHGVSH